MSYSLKYADGTGRGFGWGTGNFQVREALVDAKMMDRVPLPKWGFDAEEFKALNADQGGVIPSYKLYSNEDWHVHPEEIRRGIERGDVWDYLDREYIDAEEEAFIRWVMRAADHGGFIVR